MQSSIRESFRYCRKNSKGFTLGDVLKFINITGYEAMKAEYRIHPENFDVKSEEEAASSVSEYAIGYFHIHGKNIYVAVEH